MTLPTIYPKSRLVLKIEPLTPAAFEPFGTVVAAPLTQTLTSFPSEIPTPLYPKQQPRPVPANQSTALKTSPISPLINSYPGSTTGQGHVASHPPGKGLMSIFSSFPRRNVYLSSTGTSPSRCHKDNDSDSAINNETSTFTATPTPRLKLGILERHPYTTQTFCPFNYSSTSKPSTTTSPNTTSTCHILIIVAPTFPSPETIPANPPDLPRLRAFIYPLNDPTRVTQNVAITYNAGTWHAPMIVLGDQRVDFLVTQFANGVGEDDCQEVLVGSGPDGNVLTKEVRKGRMRGIGQGEREVEVEVDLEGVYIGGDFGEDSKDNERGKRTSKL